MPELQSAAPRTPSRSMKANLLKNIQFLLVLRSHRLGLGLTDRVIAVRWSFLHPAAAALPAVAGAAGSGAAANDLIIASIIYGGVPKSKPN